MKFYNYLNEEDDVEKWISLIQEKCKPYLDLVKNDDRLLFSGRKTNDGVFRRNVRKDRNPVDTPKEVHELLDTQFKQKFGVKARSNSIFCYFKNMNFSNNSTYGNPYYIFPIGKFKTIWSPNIQDLFDEVQNMFESKYLDNFNQKNWKNIGEEIKEEFLDELEEMFYPKDYTDKSIIKMNSEYTEIMVHCKEYIGVKQDIFKYGMKGML